MVFFFLVLWYWKFGKFFQKFNKISWIYTSQKKSKFFPNVFGGKIHKNLLGKIHWQPTNLCIFVVQDAQWLKMWAAKGIQCMVLIGAFSLYKAQLQQDNKVVGWECFWMISAETHRENRGDELYIKNAKNATTWKHCMKIAVLLCDLYTKQHPPSQQFCWIKATLRDH